MKKKKEFRGTLGVEVIDTLKGKYTNNGDTTEVVLSKLGVILVEAKNLIGEDITPILTKTLYTEEGSEVAIELKCILKVAKKDALETSRVVREFTILGEESMYDKFIDELKRWYYTYKYDRLLNENLTELNREVDAIIEECNLPYKVKFVVLGTGTKVGVEKGLIKLGVDEGDIIDLSEIALFDERGIEVRQENYREMLRTTLKGINSPLELLKVKTQFTEDLGLYTRVRVSTLIKGIGKRKIDSVRVGIGYSEDEETIAIVEKKAIKESDVEKYKAEGYVISRNTKASNKEMKAGLTHIATDYVLEPLNKVTYAIEERQLEV